MDQDDVATEDRKPFDNEAVKEEEDLQPEPDEILSMDAGCGRVWSVKIPKHLMEKWSAIDEEGKHLATIRVYDSDPRTGRTRIMLLIPPSETDDPESLKHPDEYELDMVNETVENQVVIAEREKEPKSRARTTILTGTVKHECNLRPLFTDNYRKRMKERHRLANTPKRQIRMVNEVEPGRGRLNQLTSGMGRTNAFSNLVQTKPPPKKGEKYERFARLPRNQLLDALFSLYREKQRWSAKELRQRTEQPEGYLKEVLQEIADLHRSGEHTGLYELKLSFRESVKSEAGASAAAASLKTSGGDEVVDADLDDDFGDDDDDEDMEEIS